MEGKLNWNAAGQKTNRIAILLGHTHIYRFADIISYATTLIGLYMEIEGFIIPTEKEHHQKISEEIMKLMPDRERIENYPNRRAALANRTYIWEKELRQIVKENDMEFIIRGDPVSTLDEG